MRVSLQDLQYALSRLPPPSRVARPYYRVHLMGELEDYNGPALTADKVEARILTFHKDVRERNPNDRWYVWTLDVEDK